MQVTFRGVSLANHESNSSKTAFMVNPRSKLYRIWETVNTLCIFLTCLIIPFQASFDSQLTGFWIITYIFDVFFLADVVLRFFVGYYEKGSLITDRPLISRRYLRSTFIPDILAILPLDIFVFAVGSHLRWHQALALWRLNRLLRVQRLLKFFGKLHLQMQNAFSSRFLRAPHQFKLYYSGKSYSFCLFRMKSPFLILLNPFTLNSTKPKIDKFFKITDWVKLKNK